MFHGLVRTLSHEAMAPRTFVFHPEENFHCEAHFAAYEERERAEKCNMVDLVDFKFAFYLCPWD